MSSSVLDTNYLLLIKTLRFPLERERNENVPHWLLGLSVFTLSLSLLTVSLPHRRSLGGSPLTGIWRQTASSQASKDGAQAAPCAQDPKMVSSRGGIPKGSVPAEGTTKSLGQSGHWWGHRGLPCLAQTLLTSTKDPFRGIGWHGSSRAFLRAHARNTNEAASLGCHTDWPQSPRM